MHNITALEVELRQRNGKGLEGIERGAEVQVEAVLPDLAKLRDDEVNVIWRHQLEVLDARHRHAAVEVEAVIA